MFGKKKENIKPVILLESWSPSCKNQAFVEESDISCYFYLWVHPGEENAIRSCWIFYDLYVLDKGVLWYIK